MRGTRMVRVRCRERAMNHLLSVHRLFLTLALGLSCAATCAAQVASKERAAQDATYIRWLEERSMLYQAREQARTISGQGVQWQHAYGEPQPREAVKVA